MKNANKTQKSNSLISIDDFVDRHEGNVAAAARAVGAEYIQFRRWLKRIVYAPEHASTRAVMAGKGVELPRRVK